MPFDNDNLKLQFASDNYSGICPQAAESMAQANASYSPSYGEDPWTQEVSEKFREIFETDCEVFFVFNGTAANSLALASLCQSYHSVLCHQLAHIETDECGGPEFASNGSKILTVGGEHGKIDLEALKALIIRRQDIHFPKPKVVSITQATEVGTLYSLEELSQLKKVTQKHQLLTHMDGARFANAAAALPHSPAELTWKSGIDVLCFSGTKNGLAFGEAILFFNKELAEDFAYRCKQAGQLASKMRFIAAPWLGLLKNETWLNNGRHANQSAQYLSQRLLKIPGVTLAQPTQANGVFVNLPKVAQEILRESGWRFYDFIGSKGVRLMCTWNTQEEAIDAFVADTESACERAMTESKT